MSSSFDLAQLARVLSSLLAVEKNQTRNWLRNEMDRLVDPMLDSIFQRLNNKLMNANLNQSGNCGNRAQMNSSSDHVKSPNPQSLHPYSIIAQPSISVTSSLNAHCNQPHSIGYEPEYDPEILAQVKREIKEEEIDMALQNVMNKSSKSNRQIEDRDEYEEDQQFGHILQHSPPQLDKNRFSSDDGDHHMSHNIAMTFVEHEQLDNHAIYDDNNQQPNGKVNNVTQQNWDKPQIQEEGDDGQMVQIEEDELVEDANGENGKMMEDNEEDKYLSVDNESMDPTPPHPTGHFQVRQSGRKRKQLHEEQKKVNNRDNREETEEEDDDDDDAQETVTSLPVKRPRQSRLTISCSTKQKQIITLTLQCPQCDRMFAKGELNKHLKAEHSTGSFRCLVKDCKETFDNSLILGHHLAQSHQSTCQWHCGQCEHHSTSYHLLSIHCNQLHKLGRFQCSFAECTFTGEYKRKVYDHYKHKHKIQPMKKCQHSGCSYHTQSGRDFKRHQLVHLGIKPYRCKWPQCVYASTRRFDTIKHIRRMHLPLNTNSEIVFTDPNDFVEMVK